MKLRVYLANANPSKINEKRFDDVEYFTIDKIYNAMYMIIRYKVKQNGTPQRSQYHIDMSNVDHIDIEGEDHGIEK